jgi:beta-lysine 5,6-aminomutase beta subunit
MRDKHVLPYGDRMNDGMVQVSFTLPVSSGPLGEEAARQLMKNMHLQDPHICYSYPLGQDFTFYVGYGKMVNVVDLDRLDVPHLDLDKIDAIQINEMVKERLGRPIVVIGAATGYDAHTVGLDAILNYKGFSGDHGLEAYSAFTVVNMGSQVPNEELAAKAKELHADAILVSQVVTEKNVHLSNLAKLVDILDTENIRQKVVLIAGGPRINHLLAVELGFDAGFGAGTKPSEVASYIAREVLRRKSY